MLLASRTKATTTFESGLATRGLSAPIRLGWSSNSFLTLLSAKISVRLKSGRCWKFSTIVSNFDPDSLDIAPQNVELATLMQRMVFREADGEEFHSNNSSSGDSAILESGFDKESKIMRTIIRANEH